MIKNIIILIILIIAAIQDIKNREVSNLISLFILIISLYNFKIVNIAGLTLTPMPLIITNIIHKDSFGGADIKIIGSLGLCYGFTKTFFMLLIALLLSLIIKIITKKESVPFVPYILVGFIIINI